jgi:xanthosine utilization system XapX-like protein
MVPGLGKLAGLIVGLVFGWVWVQDSFADAVLVALTGLLGYLVAAIATGEIDVIDILARRRQ